MAVLITDVTHCFLAFFIVSFGASSFFSPKTNLLVEEKRRVVNAKGISTKNDGLEISC